MSAEPLAIDPLTLAPLTLSDAERAAGLADPLPAGERILWQAKPDPRALSRSVFHLRGLALYGLAAAVAVIASVWRERPLGQAVATATLLLPVFALAIGILSLIGRATARATTYTLTNRRMILHIGIAYEMTVSVPLSAVTGAAMRRGRDGAGEIAFSVSDRGGVGYIALWPHARFGRFLAAQPMLRGLAEPERVRDLVADALVAFNAGGRARVPSTPAPAAAPMPASVVQAAAA